MTEIRTYSPNSNSRIEWVDYAKGLCIILVVMMQATTDYGHTVGAEGWLHSVVDFARPFRMPDFFLLSGLFLARSINSPLREYIDRKVIHFAYFYLLWLCILLLFTETSLMVSDPAGFVSLFGVALVDPINSLWFVHMLMIFYVVTRAVRKFPVLLVFVVAIGLQTLFRMDVLTTEWNTVNRFLDRYVYFFAGYAFSQWIFAFASRVRERPGVALGGIAVWALCNGWFTYHDIDEYAGVSLVLGFLGAAAVVSFGSLLAQRKWAGWLRYTGANSIVVYLSYFLPMKVMLKLLSGSGVVSDVGLASAIVTVAAVVLPLLFHRAIRDTSLRFLYVRPDAFRLTGKQGKSVSLNPQ